MPGSRGASILMAAAMALGASEPEHNDAHRTPRKKKRDPKAKHKAKMVSRSRKVNRKK